MFVSSLPHSYQPAPQDVPRRHRLRYWLFAMAHDHGRQLIGLNTLIDELVLRYSDDALAKSGLGTCEGGGEMDQAYKPDPEEEQISDAVHGLALIAAYEAALAVASEVRLEPILQRIVDLSRTVVPARYAALGLFDADGHIVRLLTSGLTDEEIDRLGPTPHGHGLLGPLLRDDAPLLIDDISSHPDAAGFPAHHPIMSSLVGVPIRLNGETLGNLYLADSESTYGFDDDDIVALRILADHAAAAIDRARLYRTVEKGQEQAEEQLRQLREILDTMPAGVLVIGRPNAHVDLANRVAMEMIFGPDYQRSAVPIAEIDFQWLDAEGLPLPRSLHPGVRALAGETIGNRQVDLRPTNRDLVPVLVQSAPLRKGDGEVIGAVVVFQDVTRMRAAEQIKDDFLSLISHEFRTPLTAIHGGAHLLATQGAGLDEETRQELLEDIVVESGRLDRMLSNLLRVSEIMAGRFQASTEPLLLAPLIQPIIEEYRRRSPGFEFSLDIPDDLPLADGDPELLLQIMRNLYENAVKYSPNGGTIRTRARQEREWVSIQVQDEGLGISPEYVQQVFERFRRPGAEPTIRGMGLGLYLSRLLVDAQGGHIRANSAGSGKGATFIVDLPLEGVWSRGADHSRIEGAS